MSINLRRWAIALLALACCVFAVAQIMTYGRLKVEQAIRTNLVAANLLTRIQLAGERMRRFEKELFIYAAVPDARDKYAKEFGAAYEELLIDLDKVLASSNRAFTDEERSEAMKWKTAALTYTREFEQVINATRLLDRPDTAVGARLRTTVDFNKAIEPGKDAFRALLNGTETMRNSKKTDAIAISREVDMAVARMLYFVIAVVAAGMLIVTLMLRGARLVTTVFEAMPQGGSPPPVRRAAS